MISELVEIKLFNVTNKPSFSEKNQLIDFLHFNMGDFTPSKETICKSIDYAVKETPSFGGFIVVSHLNEEITGVAVINQTGMTAYNPENLLVYLATAVDHRKKGIAKRLVAKTIDLTNGNIALNIAANDPSTEIYQHFGFTNSHRQMRFIK
ncbi:MAG: ribosomal-protein-alanine N-acetyltransferase [Lentimonas sp.]|jgi:ribosomal-protein-alanine N-acetyltransferase